MSPVVCTIQVTCPDCEGEGRVDVPVSCHHSTIQDAISCARCGGSDIDCEPCPTCYGFGEVPRQLFEGDLDEYVIDAIRLHHIEQAARAAA